MQKSVSLLLPKKDINLNPKVVGGRLINNNHKITEKSEAGCDNNHNQPRKKFS